MLVIIALINTLVYFTNKEKIDDEQEVEVEKTPIKTINEKAFILLGLIDTIDISKNIQLELLLKKKSNFDNILFAKKSDIFYNSDSTNIKFFS